MIKKKIYLLSVFLACACLCHAQAFIETEKLFENTSVKNAGRLNIIQNRAVDTLISRSITGNRKRGIQGFRIQIYYSSIRTAREEASKIRAEFISKFPEIVSYTEYQEPGWFMVRAGNYRSKIEAYKDLLLIRRVFPNAYTIPSEIEAL